MADISDVLTVVTQKAASAVYPNGTSSPSVAGVDVRIYPGWPQEETLNNDILAGKAHVSVFPTNIQRVTSRFPQDWETLSINAATLTLTINNAGTTITVGGTVSVPQTVMIIYNGIGYSYSVQANDTLNSIATGIAAALPNGVASASSAVVTVNGAYSLIGRISTSGTSIRELSRREHVIAVDVWTPSDTIRTAIASAIEIAFNALERIAMPDGYYARIKYASMNQIDDLQKARVYRRNLSYTVEYAVTQTETDYTIADQTNNVTSGQTGMISP